MAQKVKKLKRLLAALYKHRSLSKKKGVEPIKQIRAARELSEAGIDVFEEVYQSLEKVVEMAILRGRLSLDGMINTIDKNVLDEAGDVSKDIEKKLSNAEKAKAQLDSLTNAIGSKLSEATPDIPEEVLNKLNGKTFALATALIVLVSSVIAYEVRLEGMFNRRSQARDMAHYKEFTRSLSNDFIRQYKISTTPDTAPAIDKIAVEYQKKVMSMEKYIRKIAEGSLSNAASDMLDEYYDAAMIMAEAVDRVESGKPPSKDVINSIQEKIGSGEKGLSLIMKSYKELEQ